MGLGVAIERDPGARRRSGMRARLDRNPFAAADKLYDGNRVDMAWSAEQIRALLAVAPRHAGRLWGALDLPGG